jgi:hypothetical protein
VQPAGELNHRYSSVRAMGNRPASLTTVLL